MHVYLKITQDNVPYQLKLKDWIYTLILKQSNTLLKQSTGPAVPNQLISLATPLPAILSLNSTLYINNNLLYSTLYPVISMST